MNYSQKELLGGLIKSWINRKNFKTLKVLKFKRDRVLKEIIDTERLYVKYLDNVVNHFMIPLKRIDKPVISNKNIDIIFQNFPSILYAHQTMFSFIKHNETLQGVIESFLSFVPHLQIYREYVLGYEDAAQKLRKKDASTEFHILIEKMAIECGSSIPLASLLITPVSRVPRYKLLFDELMKFTEIDSKEYLQIQQIRKELTIFSEEINKVVREKNQIAQEKKVKCF
ncbi:pleckstrin (PH) domain-containing protein [Tieghemostelium lacteum]|uniref:Pleckstrin (PH) domain-containing protein n=1 Tax=Tieghemostelium lacteum TaxID=361077 RepID=A0A151ZJ18_TIELA|nr:pleckstrin (PH) domain-containing protein [Tieghemostelium lacteum]|eukprot:KYQ93844.1 pleckstrin (PH) domain-containing protein [Tieghemostelium lacteum]